ncbi:MAG: endolytic transglycosylase MltG [Candidatus Saccharimonadales bacterium]
MSKYIANHKSIRLPRRVLIVGLALVVIFIVGSIFVRKVYDDRLQPVSSSSVSQIVTINSGSSVKDIADLLAKDHLIRSSWAMQLYVHSANLTDKLQAGTYALAPDLSTQQVVKIITSGIVASKLVTIIPGTRIDQVRAALINDGYSPATVDNALNPSLYSSLPVMSFVPPGTKTLEGLLWPDSFEKTSTTPLTQIISESLNEMSKHLTPSVQAAFASEGLTTYQGLILTSIVNQEVSQESDQAQVAQVFLSRLKSNTPLGSDVTANYGAIEAGQPPSLSYDSPYNTLIHTGLPPTPISTISASALTATTHPANTNWLYFVTGDNGITYFSTTLQQQQANTAMYCHKLCAQP